jgi:phosphate transport system substrate-binding protein
MNITKNKISLILLIIIIAFVYFSCDFGEIKSKATIGQMTIVVDENLKPVTVQFIKEFQRLNSEAKIEAVYKPTKNTVADLFNKETKLIIITGDLASDDKKFADSNKIEMQRFEIGIDALAFIVNPDNPVDRLTSEDLKKIFTGQYTEWTQVKVQDEEQNNSVKSKMNGSENNIKLFIQRPNSNTYSYVKDTVLSGMGYDKAAQICSTSVQMLDEIRIHKNAIGIINMSWMSKGSQDIMDTTVKPIRISRIWQNGWQEDFAQFHQGLIFTKKYPYTRKIVLYTTDYGIQLSTGFITFLVHNDGQKVVLDNGLVPINQPIRTIQIE